MSAQSTAISSFQVFPARPPAHPVIRPLSILDTSCSDFFSFSAAKVYSPSPPHAKDPFEPSLLRTSLAHILSAYPHFAGKVRLARPDDDGRPYQKRFGRVWIEYGKESDPGVALIFSEKKVPLETCLPKQLGEGLFDATSLNEADVYPETGSVVQVRPTPTEGPALAIRVTRFSDGGVVLAFQIVHTLADASTLNRFAADWGDVHRALLVSGSTEGIFLPSRPFDPEALDSHAAGDLDASFPDSRIEEEYRRIPRTAIDMWANPEQHPHGAVRSSAPVPELREQDEASGKERGKPAPWATWDMAAPVSLRAVDLSAGDLQRLWRRAQASSVGCEDGEASSSCDPVKLTAHDALVGHFWRLSMKARDLPPDTLVSLTPAVGVRTRLDPPLPTETLGSPFVLLRSEADYSSLTSPSTGPAVAASAIRRTINSATPSNLAALLHHAAHVLDPIRIWPYFCGDTHTSMSSWIGAGSYTADFGSGAPILAEGVLPAVDNMLLFEDAVGAASKAGKWHEKGVRVKLALREDVMEKVLADPELRG
ncbi:hypothetical protein JCM11251_006477 [Rhodosporidiobolus azoricus]